ncbi:jg26632, partial [Pararge aegeria aegeria]
MDEKAVSRETKARLFVASRGQRTGPLYPGDTVVRFESFTGKELEIELFVEKFNIHILCITEHWLTGAQIAVNINNFKMSSVFFRKTAIHGGSLIFVRNNITCKERKDIVSLSVERIIELSCVELERFIIVCVYHPPSGDFNQFEDVMEDVLKRLYSLNSSPTAAQNLLRGNINECKVLFHFKHIDASDIIKNFKLLKLKKT